MRKQLAVVAMLTVTSWVAASSWAQPPAAETAGGGQAPVPSPECPSRRRRTTSSRSRPAPGGAPATGKGPDGQEMKYNLQLDGQADAGRSLVHDRLQASEDGADAGFEGNATVGFNTAEKKYSFVGFDSFGGWIDLSSPDGAAYTGQGGGMGKVTPVKFTFTPGKDKKGEESDKLFDVTLDFGTRHLDRELQEVAATNVGQRFLVAVTAPGSRTPSSCCRRPPPRPSG